MLHARRKRIKALAEAEAAGKSFWTKEFSRSDRLRIWYAILDTSGGETTAAAVTGFARHLIMTDEGLPFLSSGHYPPHADFNAYLLECPDEMVPTLVEATYRGLRQVARVNPGVIVGDFERTANEILNESRISYDLINGQMIEFESKELHQAVVEPALRLLAGRAEFAAVETAYQKALKEISDGDPADAITDAATALQELLNALGVKAGTLDAQARAAREKGLLRGHDLKLTDWVTGDRSTTGDAHNATPAKREDAWLTVHVAGALILRLAEGTAR